MKTTKQKIIKVTALVCACAIMASVIFVSVAQSAKAATNTATKIDYSSLASYVARYNPELQIAENDVLKSEKATTDINKSVSELVDQYAQARDKYNEARENPLTPPETLNQLQESMNKIQEQIDSTRKQSTNSNHATRSQAGQAALTYQQKLSVAQQTFLNHYSLVAQKENAISKLEGIKTKITTAQKKYDLEMLALVDLEKIKDEIAPQQQIVSDIDYQIHKNMLQLKALLGIPLAIEISYGALPTLDFSYIASINIGSDLPKHIATNQSIKIKQGSLNAAKETAELNSEVQSAALALDQAIKDATIAFESTYSQLHEKHTQLLNSKKALEVRINDMAKQKIKLQKGMISKNKFKEAQDTMYQAERNYIIEQIALFTLMENYKVSLNG